MSERLRVLVSAYACSPVRGSEPGIGWGWVRAIAPRHDLWVLTDSRFRGEIEAALDQQPELRKHLHFTYVPRYRALLLERLWPPAYLATYKYQWQRAAYRAAVELHRKVRFDLAHQLTYEGFRTPGHLWKLGIPFVWGPIGGLEQTPWRLLPALEWQGVVHFACRNLWNDFDRRFARAPRQAFRKAVALIAATSSIRAEILRFYGRDSHVVCEIGRPPVTASRPARRSDTEDLELIWSGIHIPRKALPILFEALAKLPRRVRWRLKILGTGPRTDAWKRTCVRLGLAGRCTWLGHVGREHALRAMQQSHVFVISSVYDLTSTVLIEALANGLPVICPDLYGFRDAVTETCGFRVSASSPRSLVNGIARAIIALHDNEALRYSMAAAALARSADFSWERKAEDMHRIYQEAVRTNSGWGAAHESDRLLDDSPALHHQTGRIDC